MNSYLQIGAVEDLSYLPLLIWEINCMLSKGNYTH